ncbi:hypothetical protein BV20DRAFT_948573 [Pilatotrama ljubarskyi]|nr:hypothetical protein BV20DRAFT_948573 [Pilatotrama ljubarskyi]
MPPAVYQAPDGQKCSPFKGKRINNFDPGKAGKPLQPAAPLDRLLLGESSMGSTLLVDFDAFTRDILPPLPPHATKLSKNTLASVRRTLYKKFRGKIENNRPVKLREDPIAEAVVDAINSIDLPGGYVARLSRCKADLSDDTGSKVDGALYPPERDPGDSERPDWTHCRLYLEFKTGDISYDPWDDRPKKSSEAEPSSRAKVRSQLTAYAQNTFLYQHRTALLSLFIIGEQFRALWWDRSGVTVSRKVNYIDEPESLLGLIWHYVQLSDQGQGIDPTATHIEENSEAFLLMDELAKPDPALDMDYLEPGTEHINTEFSRPSVPVGTPPCSAGSPTTSTSEGRPEQSSKKQVHCFTDPDLPEPKDDGADPRVFRYVREAFRDSLAPGWPRYKLRVGQDDRVFLVAKPFFKSSSMFGRVTRGYVAIDPLTRRFVFLKDSWRPYYKGVEPEGTYLQVFSEDPDMVVPTVICHGDVRQQQAFNALYQEEVERAIAEQRIHPAGPRQLSDSSTSVSNETMTKKRRRADDDDGEASSAGTTSPQPNAGTVNTISSDHSLRRHMHYRIAVKEVCLAFSEFRTTKQLIRLMYDCIATHHWAYARYNLLHRDVSAGNVLILPTLRMSASGREVVVWRGLLTDWELAKSVAEAENDRARQPERTGTWQFMSVDYVDSYWTRPVVVADELESFLHVLLFYAVRYLPNTLPDVTEFVINYFDTFQRQRGCERRWSGHAKRSAMETKIIKSQSVILRFLKTTGDVGNPLNTLVYRLLELLGARYEVLNFNQALSQKEGMERGDDKAAVGNADASPDTSSEVEDDVLFTNDPWDTMSDAEVTETKHELDAKTIELAATLETHISFLRIFSAIMKKTPKDGWRNTEVVPKDQLVDYEPRIVWIALGGSTTAGARKRPKTESVSSFAAHKVAATDSAALATTRKKGKGRA